MKTLPPSRGCNVKLANTIFLPRYKNHLVPGEKMEAPPVTVMPVTGGTINMMEYLLQGKL